MAPVNDYGIKVSQKGFDAKTAADYQLVFSSSWPLLKIHSQGAFTVADTTTNTTIATHSLGYNPMFWVFDNSTLLEPVANASRIVSTGLSQYIGTNTTDLKYQGLTRGSPGGSFSGYYFIFRQNLLTSFTAPVVTTTAATIGASGNYKFAIAQITKDVSSTSLKDYVIHSNSRSPMIHKSGNFANTATTTITHSLGYSPMFFVYTLINSYGDSRYQQVFNADDSYITSNSTTLTINENFGAGTTAYAILKDPFLVN